MLTYPVESAIAEKKRRR